MDKIIDGKMCPNCYSYKPLSEYGKRMKNGKNIGQGYCKTCKKILDKAYVKAKREKISREPEDKQL